MTQAMNMPVTLISQGGTANRETTLPNMPGASDFGRDRPGQGSDSSEDRIFGDPV